MDIALGFAPLSGRCLARRVDHSVVLNGPGVMQVDVARRC
jgi:hypothetical protein